MNDKKIRILVILTAFFLLIAGAILYVLFEKNGMGKVVNNKYVSYNVKDYVEITPVVFNSYSDVYNSINVSKVTLKNLDESLTSEFMTEEEKVIDYITGYYNEIRNNNMYLPVNTVSSIIKTQINGAVLSIFYRLDFTLDDSIFYDNIKSYIVTTNIDLRTNKVLTNDDLLSKYSYAKSYIVDKLFTDEILIDKSQIVIDKNTNISLTRSDIERKKDEYIVRIISEFDSIIDVYIENDALVLVYNSKELKSIFFDNELDTNIKFKYLK